MIPASTRACTTFATVGLAPGLATFFGTTSGLPSGETSATCCGRMLDALPTSSTMNFWTS